MKRLVFPVLVFAVAFVGYVLAQSAPTFTQGLIPTIAQWQSYFTTKVDVTNGTLNSPTINTPSVSGGTFASPSLTSPSVTGGLGVSGGVTGDISAATATATGGTVARTTATRATDLANIVDFGAKADAQTCYPVLSITSGSKSLATDTSCVFAATDVGKAISVQGAGAIPSNGPITAVTVSAGGQYSGIPSATAFGSTGPYQNGGTDAILSVTMDVVGATVLSGGSGCTNGTQTLTLTNTPLGGTAATLSATISGGVVTAVSVLTAGSYPGDIPNGSYPPENPLTVSTTGGGCPTATAPTFTLTYEIHSISVVKGGIAYPVSGTTVVLTGGSQIVAATTSVTVTPPSSYPLITTIAGFTDAQHITLTRAASATISSASEVVQWGTDNLPAFNLAAAQASNLAGRTIYIPPGGAAYLFNGQMVLSTGLAMRGDCSSRHGTGNDSNATVTQFGSWIQGIDPLNPLIQMNHGTSVRCLNRISGMPIPSSTPNTTWTPMVAPYGIDARWSGPNKVSEYYDLNGSYGILIDLLQGFGGGVYSSIEDTYLGDTRTCLSVNAVNDQIMVLNLHCRSIWYSSNSNVITDRELNAVGIQSAYWDNPYIIGVQLFQLADSILLSNSTSLNSTHSLYNAKLTNVQCGSVRRCIRVADNGVTTGAVLDNMVVEGDTGNSISETLFQLNSNNLRYNWANLTVGATGGSVMDIGGGIGGAISIGSLRLRSWSGVVHNQTAFILESGASLDKGPTNIIRHGFNSASACYGGPGTQAVRGNHVDISISPGDSTLSPTLTSSGWSVTGNGSFGNYSGPNQIRPWDTGDCEGRISGQLTVTVAATGNINARLSNFPEITASSGFSCAGTGAITLDTGWQDLTTGFVPGYTPTINGTNIGNVQLSLPNGCVATVNNLTLEFR